MQYAHFTRVNIPNSHIRKVLLAYSHVITCKSHVFSVMESICEIHVFCKRANPRGLSESIPSALLLGVYSSHFKLGEALG